MYVECRYIYYIVQFRWTREIRDHVMLRRRRRRGAMLKMLPMFLNAQVECAETVHQKNLCTCRYICSLQIKYID